VTESTLMTGLGGVIGVVCAYWTVEAHARANTGLFSTPSESGLPNCTDSYLPRLVMVFYGSTDRAGIGSDKQASWLDGYEC
jgi:hypothetical protein